MDCVHHIWCPLFSQEFQDLPDGAETTLTYIVDIAAQIGCSERTVRRYLKYPEPPARKTRHKMVKLKPFMDYIDMRLAENVWNSEVIFAEIKAMGYTGGRSMLRYYIQPKRKMRPSKRTRRELPVKREA